MQQRNRSHDGRASLSPAELEAIVRRAQAQRDVALGYALAAAFRVVATVFGRLGRAIDEAYRLRALAALDDRRLAALGLARGDLPGVVYGWRDGSSPLQRLAPQLTQEPAAVPSDRRYAA